MMNYSRILGFFLILLLPSATAALQAQERTASPVIHEDHSVTFRMRCPQARSVILKGSFVPDTKYQQTAVWSLTKDGTMAMQKEGEWWTCTVPPLESDMYFYQFLIDGDDDRPVIDSLNPDRVRDIDRTLSFFIIPGGNGDDYLSRDVPHGRMEKVWYSSTLKGMPRRRMTVYTPAGYDLTKDTTYPVLYLLHGSGGDENAWPDCGRAAEIMDNLIASGRCVPMIVIMPNGNVKLAAAPGEDPWHPDTEPSANNMESMFGVFEKSFVPDIVRHTEKHYRVRSDKSGRAIAGLSLGGLHSIFISLNNPTYFDYVGLFSAQTTNAMNDRRIRHLRNIGQTISDFKEMLPFLQGRNIGGKIETIANGELDIYENVDAKLDAQFADPPHLYYIAVGKDDFVKKLNDEFRKKLDSRGCPYLYRESSGGHTWDNWRRYLLDFLPRLFR